MRTTRTIIAILSLALAACAKPESTAPARPEAASSLVAVEPVSSIALAIEQIQASTLTCQGDCPSSVGMFLAADEAGGFDPGSDAVLACTAVLVGPDLALTNSHCIPSAVKLLPDLCASRVRVVLPAVGGLPEQTVACSRLLGFSPRETAMSPDLALFRLEKSTGRAAVALNRSGVEPSSRLRSYRVNPNLKNRTGVLVNDLCTAVAGSFRMPVFSKTADPVFVTGDCPVIPGNSGSPVFDTEGHLRGLIQAFLPLPASVGAEWTAHLDDASFAPLAMGTSLACLTRDPAGGQWSWNPSCGTVAETDVASSRPVLHSLLKTAAFSAKVDTFLIPYRGQSPVFSLARKTLTATSLDAHETLAPSCIRPAAEWRSRFAPPGAELPDYADAALRLPRYKVSLRFNRYLQLNPPLVALEGIDEMIYQFSPRKAAAGSASLEPEAGEVLTLNSCNNLETP